ncbi:MAG: YihA family ribosome biogenesis GTP-binding protein [Deltaproteobacteria bacterium]|jgi:GTP-binding protein|nr:YihA family ribosome biogenesis GTP-binding protein [Deltaproteobacteria bacterium]
MKIHSVEFITSAPSLEGCPSPDWPEIAFAGRSNVGKSSLINCLLQRRGLVRTSSTPGRTQLLNFFAVNQSLFFVDLPGYGFAKAPRQVRAGWQPMVQGYLRGRTTLCGVVWLLDARRDPSDEDLQFLDWLEENQTPTIPVITKVDKISRNALQNRLSVISRTTGLSKDLFTLFSVPQRIGISELWELIESAVAANT